MHSSLQGSSAGRAYHDHSNLSVTLPTTIAVEGWYGGSTREVAVYSEPCVWYKSGHQPMGIRWVLVRDPQSEWKPQACLSTNPAHTPLQILTWFVRRLRMEVTFEESRAHLGIETLRQWSDLAIARTTPGPFWRVFAGHLAGRWLDQRSSETGAHGGLVHKRPTDFR